MVVWWQKVYNIPTILYRLIFAGVDIYTHPAGTHVFSSTIVEEKLMHMPLPFFNVLFFFFSRFFSFIFYVFFFSSLYMYTQCTFQFVVKREITCRSLENTLFVTFPLSIHHSYWALSLYLLFFFNFFFALTTFLPYTYKHFFERKIFLYPIHLIPYLCQ